jgi:cytochrome c
MPGEIDSQGRSRKTDSRRLVLVAILACVAVLAGRVAAGAVQTPATTSVKDKVFTKAQAEKGDASYKKACLKCHALKDGPGPEEGPPLAGDAFLTKWDGKTIHELAMSIRLNMPPDGSVTIGEEDAADLIAYILKSNGFAEGEKPLKADASAKNLVIVKSQ